MNTINTAAGATSAAQAASPAAAADTGNAAISSDFETFLVMLTAQIQNQDPLNPMDSSEYAVQLATFSSVEQQVKTNDLLTKMGGGINGGGLASYAGWVGMEARHSGPVAFDGTPVDVSYAKPSNASSAELIVYAPSGLEVQRTNISSEGSSFTWSGTTSSGGPLLTGNYTLAVETKSRNGAPEILPVESYAQVKEARLATSGAELVLANGAAVPAQTVTALRAAR